ncbi:MAG TPA: hypothetical protein VGL70_08985 [Candidatus Binatia bacterium]|jgi:hypothetical protein
MAVTFRLSAGRFFLGWVSCLLCFLSFFSVGEATAGWAGRFSLTASEEYNDNIFFSNSPGRKNESDFITAIVPTFTVLYSPPGQINPTLIANLSPSGQLYAHHSDLNNFGDNINFNALFNYQYSPRLTFLVGDAMSRGGVTRTGLGAEGQTPTTPTSVPPPGSPPTLSDNQDLTGLLNRGKVFQNNFLVHGAYLMRPRFTLIGRYGLTYTDLDAVGNEIGNSIGVRGVYAWGNHNLHVGYTVTHFSRSGNNSDSVVIHSFDLGDDYLSALQIRLSPTLTLSLSTGLGLNTGGTGPKIVNNSSATIIKLWRTAVFQAGARTGLGSNFGLSSGVAQTTTFFSGFEIRLTQQLKGILRLDYSIINGSDTDINVFRASSGLQYWITTWLSSTFTYSHRWRDSDNSTESLNRGRVAGNSVLLALTAHFDVWPNVGLSTAPMREFLLQPGLPPFATPPAPEPAPPEPPQPQSPGPPP